MIIIIICVIGGAIFGLFTSGSKDSDLSPAKGCLGGAIAGGVGGMGCLSIILEMIFPFVLAVLLFGWLMDGCSQRLTAILTSGILFFAWPWLGGKW